VIYPGSASGVVGREILVVDALEPGHYEDYRRASAVIARTGGRLSHGATLLRELKKPSAVIGNLNGGLDGRRIAYSNGRIEFDGAGE
jgi:phosphohistidine swiveling domain-containing protein